MSESESRHLSAVVNIRCTPEEKARFEAKAKSSRLRHLSAWGRSAMLDAEDESAVRLKQDPSVRLAVVDLARSWHMPESDPTAIVRRALILLAEQVRRGADPGGFGASPPAPQLPRSDRGAKPSRAPGQGSRRR